MNKFFLSERNIARQCHQLERLLNIRDNRESKRKCKRFLVEQMQAVYKKYGNRKKRNMKVTKFIY